MFRKAGILLFWLAVWQILAMAVGNSLLLVTPIETLYRLAELAGQISFWEAAAGSMARISTGFLLGFLTAVLLSRLSFRFPAAEELFKPLIGLIKTVPVASFAVLLLIWWGSSVLAVAICFLIVLPNIYLNLLEGLKAADGRLIEMAKVFRMPLGNRFFYIYRPALRPFLESGLKLSLGMCWKSGVAAEVIGTPVHSIGGQLYLSKIYLDTSGVLAWTAVIILLSVCLEKIVLRLAGKFFEWNPLFTKKAGTGKRRGPGSTSGFFPKAKQTAFLETRERYKSTGIILDHIWKSYGETKVLADVSAVYESGNTYYLTDPSGSGKTTLLKILCGLEKPDSGTVTGPDRFSMVFQEDRLCEMYSAVCNVAMVTGDRAGAEAALKRLLPEEALFKPCGQLSGGMKRRVALVRAMEAPSEAVVLDEPFTGMDAGTKQRAEEYIRAGRKDRILVIATHDRCEEKTGFFREEKPTQESRYGK